MMKKILKTIILLIILSFMLVMMNSNSSNAVNEVKKNTSTKSESSSDFKTTNEVVYTKGTTYLRKSPDANEVSKVKLTKDVELTRTGYSTSQIDGYSWSKVTYKGDTYYCLTYMLTTSKTNVAVNSNNTETTNTNSNNNTNSLNIANTNVTNENTVTNQMKNEVSNEILNNSSTENVAVVKNEVEEDKDIEQISEDPQKAAKEKAEKIRKLIFEVAIAIVVIVMVVSIIVVIKKRRDSDYYEEYDDDDDNYEEDDEKEYLKNYNSNMKESSEYKQSLGYDKIFDENKEKNTRNENFDEKLERIRKRQQEEANKNKRSINKGKHF